MKKFKITAMIALVMTAAVLFAGCGGAAVLNKPAPNPSLPMTKVTGTCELTIENKKAVIYCKTDMMDGTIFRLSVESPTGTQLAHQDIAKNGDNLKAEFDLSKFNETSYYGFATSTPGLYGKQPDAVLAKYGQKFENLESANIMWTMDGNLLVFTSGKK